MDALRRLPERLLPEEPGSSASDPRASAAPAGESFLLQVSRSAMACQFQVFLNAGQQQGAVEAALGALDLIDRLEDQLSVYRSTSEVSRINRLAAEQELAVERQLFELLSEALAISALTSGAFDITAGPLGKIWGFHRRAGRLPAPQEISAALGLVGAQGVLLDAARGTIRFRRPGVEINLNAIGKGYALDRAAAELQQRGVANFLIHGGQSSMLARGGRQGPQCTRGWVVAVRHPLRPGQRLAEISLRDRALGTSGSGNQYFHFGGRRYGHVMDPRTGYPAESLLSATILAPSAALADAVSTAAFVLGVEQTAALCAARSDVAALLVASGPRAGSIELHAAGLADDEWVRLD
jgi:thiamine biosynthesis lipoprotein